MISLPDDAFMSDILRVYLNKQVWYKIDEACSGVQNYADKKVLNIWKTSCAATSIHDVKLVTLDS